MRSREALTQTNDHPGLLRSALRMALGTLSSRVLGLVREILFAAFFPRTVTDAWIAAFRLPNVFRRLLGEGSLAVSFVPVFVEARIADEAENGERARTMVNGFFTLLCLFLATLTVVGILFAEPVLRWLLDPAYVRDVAKFAMTLRLARIMFGYVFLVTTYAYFAGILNALGMYGLPAAAPLLFNVAMIAAVCVPGTWFPWPTDGLAWGVIAGGVLQAAVLVPALARRGFLPRWSRRFRTREIARVGRGLLPGLAGVGLLQLTNLVNLHFASQLGEGPISWMAWADRLLELPLSLIAVSLGAVLLPTLSEHSARGERAKMAEVTSFSLRVNLFVGLAAAAGLFALARPIVEVIFERGQFTALDTAATTAVLRVWAFIVIPTSCVRVLAPSYYAVRRTLVPAAVAASCLALHLLLAPVLMAKYGLGGLLASSVTSASLNFLLLLFLYRRFVGGFALGSWFVRVLAFLPPVAVLWFCTQVHGPLRELWGDGFIAKVGALVVAIFTGAIGYVAASAGLHLPELRALAGRFVRAS